MYIQQISVYTAPQNSHTDTDTLKLHNFMRLLRTVTFYRERRQHSRNAPYSPTSSVWAIHEPSDSEGAAAEATRLSMASEQEAGSLTHHW